MSQEILQTKNLTKNFKDFKAVKGIDLSIKKGRVYGFLGPNGAGKSTTIRMLLGLIKPTKGEVKIFGKDLRKNRMSILKKIGSMVEAPSYYGNLTAYENLQVTAELLELDHKYIDEVLKVVKLTEWKDRQASKFSLGMKQRLGIAQALISKPELLILDEPTNGLDPSGISELRNLVKLLASEKNISVLVSSHIIAEIELMCDKVTIIKNGQTVLESADVDKLLSNQGVFWVLSDNEKGRKILEENWKVKGNVVEERLEANVSLEKLQEINSCFVERGLMIKYVDNKNKTLEDLFLNLTEGNQII